MAHHPLPEGRLAAAAARPESCHVGPTRELIHTELSKRFKPLLIYVLLLWKLKGGPGNYFSN